MNAEWSKDGTCIYYTVMNTLYRPYQVWCHKLNTQQYQDTLIYQEDDEAFFVDITKTKDKVISFYN